MPQNRWPLIIILTCIALAVIMQVPQLLHMRHPLYQGRLIELNDDEPAYLARVEEALTGRPELVEEAFVGDETMVGMHFAFIEKLYGYLFSWTGLHAPVFLQIEDSVVPVLLFLALYAFFRLCGFSRAKSYGGCLVFLAVSLYYLDRPINQRTTSLFTMAALLCVILALERHVLFGILAGILLAILLDVYFWSWTFAYVFCVLLLLTEIILWKKTQGEEKERHARRIWILLTTAGVTIVAAIPMYIKVWKVLHHPMIDAGNFRAGYTSSHLPVSWPYSILFLGMTMGALYWMIKNDSLKKKPYAMLMILTGFVVMHQQIIHGIEFRTVAGYQFPHMFAAITALLLSLHFLPNPFPRSLTILKTKKGWLQAVSLIPLLCAIVFLLGKLVDNHRVVRQWVVNESSFSGQHLATSLPVLRALPRSRFVTPVGPAYFIAAYTHHDVVYGYFLKNVLISNEELAERWCMANLGFPAIYKNITPQQTLLYNDTTRVRKDTSLREEEERTVREACARIEENPGTYLEKYDVDYLFWNEREQPTMQIQKYGEGLTKVESGEGWSMWKIPRE